MVLGQVTNLKFVVGHKLAYYAPYSKQFLWISTKKKGSVQTGLQSSSFDLVEVLRLRLIHTEPESRQTKGKLILTKTFLHKKISQAIACLGHKEPKDTVRINDRNPLVQVI